MVSKSLAFITLLLCAILAQTVTAKAPKADESESDEDDSDVSGSEDSDEESGSEDEEEEEPLYQSLSCLLFEDIGCKSECSILGSAFGYKKATGTCNGEDNVCDCQVSRDDSLASLWKAKFDSKDILQQIKNNEKKSEEVSDILDDPFQTAEEAKENLKSVLKKEQYNNLKLNDDSAAAKMKKNGKLDSAAIKKYVAEKLPGTLKAADNKTLSGLKLKPILFKALKEAKTESDEQGNEAFDELVLDVRRSENKTLGDILTEYLKKNSFKEPAKDKNEPSLADTIANYVIDELAKKVNKKPTAKTGKANAKKSATTSKKSTKKSKSKKTDDDEDTSTEETSQKNRFVLKNFDKSVFKQSGPINQNWNRNGYQVRYQRSWGGDINLVWVKGADEVRLHKSPGTDINQTWKFGKVTIRLSKSPGGNISQNWNFGNSSYQYSRSPGGSINFNWSNGKSNKKMLKMYQGFIDDWCRANDFLIQRSYCVIYDL